MIAALVAVLAVWVAAAAAYHLLAQAALKRLLAHRSQRPARSSEPPPGAAILQPLDDDVPLHERDLAALCAQGAAVYVAVESESSVAGSTALRAASHGRTPNLEVVTVPNPRGANRKVAKLIAMLARTEEEIAVFVDGDVSVPPQYLATVLAPFSDPAVAMVTCPYRSVGGSTVPSRIDVILTNAGFLPSVALAARIEGVRFALGATIAVRRRVLEETGALEPLRDVLADDWAMAERVRAAGHRITLAPLLLDHRVSDATWPPVLSRHVRWARTVRVVRPGGYAGTIVAHGFLPAVALTAVLGGAAGLGILAGYTALRLASIALNAERTGLSARDLALVPLADAISTAIYVAGIFGRTVRWGRTPLVLRPDGSVRPLAD